MNRPKQSRRRSATQQSFDDFATIVLFVPQSPDTIWRVAEGVAMKRALSASVVAAIALSATGSPASVQAVVPADVHAAASAIVLAYPGPSWTTASPRTSIVFRGASAA